jgi:hypothetical protein
MKYSGTCHCKSVEFEVETDLSVIKQCNCSICIRKQAKMIIIPKDKFTLLKGQNNISKYQFNSMKAEHYFCNTCGIYTHHIRAADPNGMGVNSGCIDGIDPFELQSDIINNK